MSQPTTRGDAAHLLWDDSEPLAARHEKAARALVAVGRMLEQCRPLGGDEVEFLDLFHSLTAADTTVFTSVWRQPFAYYWARTALELVETLVGKRTDSGIARRYVQAVGASALRDAVVAHLEAFKAFPLAVSCLAQQPLNFVRPWRPPSPLAIPATRWTLSSAGPLTILGVEGGSLLVERDGTQHRLQLAGDEPSSCDGIWLEPCPVVDWVGGQLLLQPALFNQPDLVAETQAVLDAGVGYQWQQRSLVDATLAVLATHVPEMLGQFRLAMQVAALKPADTGGTRNTSYSRLPGAFTFSHTGNPFTLAEDFVHEFHHNRLFGIDERGPFFDNAVVDALNDARYYSPWRRDPRPLYGIWHATYVFTPVVHYWLRVYEAGQAGGEAQQNLDYAADRLVRLPAMLRIAAGELDRQACWTDFGRWLFDEVTAEHRRLEEAVAAAGVLGDVPAWEAGDEGGYSRRLDADGRPMTALEAVEQHARSYDQSGSATERLAQIASAA